MAVDPTAGAAPDPVVLAFYSETNANDEISVLVSLALCNVGDFGMF